MSSYSIKNEFFLKLNEIKSKIQTSHIKSLSINDLIDNIINSNKEDYYKILNIPYDALDSEITRQYKSLISKLHPDKNKNEKASEAFHIVKEAYKNILNQEKRKGFYIIFNEAKAKVDEIRRKTNENRMKKGLEVVEYDEEAEIKGEMRKILKQFEEEKRYKDSLNESRIRREVEEREREIEMRRYQKEVDDEFEMTRDRRVRSWNRFNDKRRYYKNEGKMSNEMKTPSIVYENSRKQNEDKEEEEEKLKKKRMIDYES